MDIADFHDGPVRSVLDLDGPMSKEVRAFALAAFEEYLDAIEAGTVKGQIAHGFHRTFEDGAEGKMAVLKPTGVATFTFKRVVE